MKKQYLIKKILDFLLAAPQSYEFLQSGFVKSKHEHLRQALACAHLPVPCKVLDLGCGTGQATPLFRNTESFSYVGVDLSEKYVRRASCRFPGMTFRKADICRDTIDESGFDLALIDSVLHHLDEYNAANVLANLPRHLNRNGVLILHDMFYPDNSGISELLPRLIARFDRGAYCRGLEALMQLITKCFVVEKQSNYPLRLTGVKCCNMAVFVCKPKPEMKLVR